MSPNDFQQQLDDRAAEDKQNAQVAEQINTLKDLASEIRTLLDSLSTTGAKKLDSNVVAAISTLGKVVNSIDAIKVTSDQDIKAGLQAISNQLANLNVQPIVKVPEPSVVVRDTPIDLSPVIAAIKTLANQPAAQAPDVNINLDDVVHGLEKVQSSLENLSFPVPNFVLPFKDVQGRASQIQLDSNGNLPVTGGGGGTEYTDGGVPPLHPVGSTIEWNDGSNWQTVSTAKPLPVTASISTAGLATSVKQSDGSQKTQIVDGAGNVIGATTNALDINIKSGNPTTITANAGTNLNTSALALETGGNLAAIKTDVDKIPAQGQALAASSMPVVLPVAQITTLTPPTNTGYALDASLTTIDTDLKSNITLHAGTNIIGKVAIDQTTPGTTNLVALAANQSVNNAQINGVTPLMGNGASGTGAQRVTIASDSTGQVAPAANATATGTTIYNNTALSSTKQAVNASAGNLYGYHIYNPNSVVIYIQLWNVASASVTVGSTAPTMVLAVPAGGWADASPSGPPITFATALTIAATTTSTGSGTPTTALLCNVFYK